MKIHLLYPTLPPAIDGIGDYTVQLAMTLSGAHSVAIIHAADKPAAAVKGVKFYPLFRSDVPASLRLLPEFIQSERPDWLVLQYNPFSYGKRGCNLVLPGVIDKIRKTCRATRVAVMVHERYVPLTTIKWKIMSLWQRWQFKHLMGSAEIVFFSTEGWARECRADHVVQLPVGSNIPRISISREEARVRLGIPAEQVILGIFGNAHVSRLFEFVRLAAERVRDSGRDVKVLYIGPDGAVVREKLKDVPSITDGPLPPDEVSRRLSAIDVALSPYIDGVSARRGAFIAALDHRLPTVATRGFNTDSWILAAEEKSLLMVDADKPEEFCNCVMRLIGDAPLRQRIVEGGSQLFSERFAWPMIGDRLVGALQTIP